MNRFSDVVGALETLIDKNVSVPVYSTNRDSPGRPRRAPFVRIERPIISNTQRTKEGTRFDVLFTVNAFSDENSNVQIFDLEEKVRTAVEAKRLDIDGAHMLRPREEGSQPFTQSNEDNDRRVKQRAIEVRIRIEKTK